MIMNRKILGGIFSAALLLGGLAVTTITTPAQASDENHVATWRADGVKYDNLTGSRLTVPQPPAGYHWTKLILNGGQDGAPEGNVRSYAVQPVPSPGSVVTRPGAEISNAILCQETFPPDSKVATTEWKDGTFSCDVDHVVQTRTVVTTRYTWESELQDWALDEANATEVTETRTRAMTPEEIETCKVPEPGS
jgi:hypothetical protein